MKITDLIERIPGLTPRQVRFLVSEGFVPPPRGGRAHARYGEDHVAAIRRYQELREAGLPPAAIRIVLASAGGVPVPLARGVALLVDPATLEPSADPAAIAARAAQIINAFLKESHDADDEPAQE